MSAVSIIIGYAMRESLRRRVFAVVLLLTVLSGGLYALGAHFAFRDSEGFAGAGIVDAKAFTGSTVQCTSRSSPPVLWMSWCGVPVFISSASPLGTSLLSPSAITVPAPERASQRWKMSW